MADPRPSLPTAGVSDTVLRAFMASPAMLAVTRLADGVLLGEYGEERRNFTPIGDIPNSVITVWPSTIAPASRRRASVSRGRSPSIRTATRPM